MAHTTEAQPATTDRTGGTLRALQVFATLSVINLLWQFVTAGQLFPRGGPEELHAGGAIVLHVLTGLTAIAAGALWYLGRGPVWPTVLAVVVFVLTFVQAYYGGRSTLFIHVPGAIILTIGSVFLVAWAFVGAGRTRA